MIIINKLLTKLNMCATLFLLILGLPLFFTSCNFAVTDFCPRYNLFKGTVYMIKIDGIQYTESNPPNFYRRLTHLRDADFIGNFVGDNNNKNNKNDDNDNRYARYESATVIYYAKNINKICRFISDEIKTSSVDLGRNITWYSLKSDPTTCERKKRIVENWYAGLVFLVFASITFIFECFALTKKGNEIGTLD